MTRSRDLILAIDQGTTGTTCLLVDEHHQVVGKATQGFPQHYPRPGLVEHDAEEIWQSLLRALAELFSRTPEAPSRIAAIGLTNQRETSVLFDAASGQPVGRAVVWQDRRTAEVCTALREAGHEPFIHETTGLVLDPYFSGTKLAAMLDALEGGRARAERREILAGTIDTFLLFRLSGGRVHATEPSNACRTMLWPLAGGGFSQDLCDRLRVPKACLPEVRPSIGEFGRTKGVPGLPDGIPIAGIAGDQQAALFGQACFEPGEAKCTYGTGAFVLLNTGTEPVLSDAGLLTSVAWQEGSRTTYCLEGSTFMAGAVVEWLVVGLGLVERADDLEPLARSVASSDEVVLVPGHAGLGAPHWRPDARGLLRGLSRGTTRAHIARAALEGIALSVDELLEAMTRTAVAHGGRPLARLRVDGGAARNDLLLELQADLAGIPLERPPMLEATGLGAAFLAGLGVGLWPDQGALRHAFHAERRFDPHGDRSALEALRSRFRAAVACA